MRRWFVSCETELLKTRFVKLSLRDRVKFFEENKEDFDFTSVSLSDHLDKNLVKVGIKYICRYCNVTCFVVL